MKRRAFLGFLGGAAVAGPQAAKSAAEMTMADLRFPGIAGNAMGSLGGRVASGPDIGWAKSQLAKLVGLGVKEREVKKMRYWSDGLSPDVAVLRSVSLPRKIAMSKDRQFEASLRNERGYLEGVIAGWWE